MTVKFKLLKRLSFIAPLFLLLLTSDIHAQAYKLGVGWRFGTSVSGVSVRVAPVKGLAFEGILGLFPNGTTATFLIERQQPVIWRFLQVYGGGGAHARFHYRNENVTGRLAFQIPLSVERAPSIGIGIDVVAGLELKIPLVPIAINAEIKPSMEFTPAGNLDFALDPAVGVKMTFGTYNKRRKNRSNRNSNRNNGLFGGNNHERERQNGGLFGRRDKEPENERRGLFGKKKAQPEPERRGLFGKKKTQPEPERRGLFNRKNNDAQEGGIFHRKNNRRKEKDSKNSWFQKRA